MPMHHLRLPEGVVTVWGELESSLLQPLRRPTFLPQAKTPRSPAMPAQSADVHSEIAIRSLTLNRRLA